MDNKAFKKILEKYREGSSSERAKEFLFVREPDFLTDPGKNDGTIAQMIQQEEIEAARK